MQTVPSVRLQNTPPPYLPAIMASRRAPTGWRCSAPSKGIRVIELHDAVQFLPGVVFRPQVGNGGIAQLPLGKADVVAVAVHQAAPGTDGEHPALDLCAYGVQIRPVGKEIALASASQAPGPDGKAGLAVHLDDNEVDG